MMAQYKEGQGQFNESHNWSPGEHEYLGAGEISKTSKGDYVVTKGMGRLKWAVNHPDSNWEVLGTTKREVRAEADNHLRNLLEGDKDK